MTGILQVFSSKIRAGVMSARPVFYSELLVIFVTLLLGEFGGQRCILAVGEERHYYSHKTAAQLNTYRL